MSEANFSNIKVDGGFVGELLFLDADNRSVHLVVNVRQVTGSGSLTDTTEFVIYRTVTEANPTLVGTEIRNGNATKMSANSRAAKYR